MSFEKAVMMYQHVQMRRFLSEAMMIAFPERKKSWG